MVNYLVSPRSSILTEKKLPYIGSNLLPVASLQLPIPLRQFVRSSVIFIFYDFYSIRFLCAKMADTRYYIIVVNLVQHVVNFQNQF